jgi:hypothetical protein
MWYYLAVLAVLASCGLEAFAGADADKKETPKPVPREIVKAWRGMLRAGEAKATERCG